jgi:hypothetical protein
MMERLQYKLFSQNAVKDFDCTRFLLAHVMVDLTSLVNWPQCHIHYLNWHLILVVLTSQRNVHT